MAGHPAQLKDLAHRVGGAIAQLAALQSDLLRALDDADGVQANLHGLFCLPVPSRQRQALEPWQTVSHRVQIGFEPGAEVGLAAEPKLDHSLSPESCLGSVTIDYRGQSQYLCLAAWCSWNDIAAAERFQLGVYGVPSRPVSCRVVLRLPEAGGRERDVELSAFTLDPAERANAPSGAVELPQDVDLDRERFPLLVIHFDTRRELEIRLDYLSLYFA